MRREACVSDSRRCGTQQVLKHVCRWNLFLPSVPLIGQNPDSDEDSPFCQYHQSSNGENIRAFFVLTNESKYSTIDIGSYD